MRNQLRYKNNSHANPGHNEEGWINHRQYHLSLQFLQGLQIVSLSVENGIESTTGLSGRSQTAIQWTEAGTHSLKGRGKRITIPHQLTNLGRDSLETSEFLTIFHRPKSRLQL